MNATPPAGAAIRRAVPTRDRVALPDLFLDEEVVEQPHDRDPQLQRRVREPDPGAQRDDVRAMPPRTLTKVTQVAGDLRPASRLDLDTGTIAPREVVHQRPRVRLHRSWRAT